MGNLFSTEPDPVLPEPIVTFRRKITKDDEFAKLIKHVTEIFSTLGTVVTLIPGVGIEVKAGIITYKELLKWVYALIGNQKEIISALIDEKIEEALAISATSQINTRIDTIKKRIKTMNDEKITIEDRKPDAITALNSCEEILGLFSDENYCLWNAVVISSQLLIAFVAIYADVIKKTFELVPSHKETLIQDLAETVKTLTKYREAVIKERVQEVYMEARGIDDRSSFSRRDVTYFKYIIRGDEKWTKKLDLNWTVINWDKCITEPPWDELLRPIKIIDKWIPWERRFPWGNSEEIAVNKYKSYKNELRKVYESEFEHIIGGLNDLNEIISKTA